MNKKSPVKSSENKALQFKRQRNVSFQLFVRYQQFGIQVKLEELVNFPVSPVPYSIATVDDFFSAKPINP